MLADGARVRSETGLSGESVRKHVAVDFFEKLGPCEPGRCRVNPTGGGETSKHQNIQ